MNKFIFGIIGGAGVKAGIKIIDLVERSVTAMGAYRDSHHPEIILWQATSAPSRSMYLEGRGESFVDDYIDVATKLKHCGAKKIMMGCNTAHAKFDIIKKKSKTEILNLLEETAKATCKKYRKVKKIGILCSDGTKKYKLFDSYFEENIPGVEIIYPDTNAQKNVTMGICNVKNSNNSAPAEKNFDIAIKNLCDKKVDLIVFGCTDIRVAVEPARYDFPIIDTCDVMKDVIIDEWLKNCELGFEPKTPNRIYGKKENINPLAVKKFFETRFIKDKPLDSIMLRSGNKDDIAEKRNNSEIIRVNNLLNFKDKFNVLDVGCGLGRFVEILSNNINSYDGIDFTEKYINFASKEYASKERINFHCMLASDIDTRVIKPSSYNLIIITAVMLYMNDEEVSNLFEILPMLCTNRAQIYIRESISIIDTRLTLKDFFSDELQTYYNALYRTQAEFDVLIKKHLTSEGFTVINNDLVLDENLGARKETNQMYWYLTKGDK